MSVAEWDAVLRGTFEDSRDVLAQARAALGELEEVLA